MTTGEALAERCAEAFATVRQFPQAERAAVLDRFGFDEEQFLAALATVGREIVSRLSQQDPRLLLRFASAYGSTDRMIRQERPRVKDLRPVCSVPPRAAAPAPGAAAPAGAVAAVQAPRPMPRLVRFDSQTGRRLAEPRWEDD